MNETYEDMEERVLQLIKIQKQLRSAQQDFVDTYLEADDLGTIEDSIYCHVDEVGKTSHEDEHEITRQFYNMMIDYRSEER
jgi:hypothetical protein